MNKLKYPILFITRTYPPVLGGLEMLSYNLTTTISKYTRALIIKNPYGKYALPFFIPWAFIKAILILLFNDVKVIHLSDGVLAPVGYALRFLFPKIKLAITIHGLDLTYVENLPIYYYTNIVFIRKIDTVIAVSEETKKKCIEYGVKEDKIKVILNGTHADQFFDEKIKTEIRTNGLWKQILPSEIANSITEKFIILYLGRLAVHKGIPWFVENVMPNLPSNSILLVAGMGSEYERIKKAIAENKLDKQVYLLGAVSEEVKKFLLNASDILIMPNIIVPGNREGFGITAIEAGSCELVPVVAGIQGLKDAVKDKESGLRVPTKNKAKYVETIKYLMDNPEERIKLGRKARKYVKENFDWSGIGRKYLEEFRKLEL
ncbi:MAG: glycosyltransferase family 4 protein [Candidatus Moraniibacteriota bacterium]